MSTTDDDRLDAIDRRGGAAARRARHPRGRGVDHPVVAGAFPDDHFPSSGDVVVVARDADGREVARNTAVLGDRA